MSEPQQPIHVLVSKVRPAPAKKLENIPNPIPIPTNPASISGMIREMCEGLDMNNNTSIYERDCNHNWCSCAITSNTQTVQTALLFSVRSHIVQKHLGFPLFHQRSNVATLTTFSPFRAMQRVIDDVRTAMRSPEMSMMDKRILNSRLKGYWLRCEYVLINAIAIASVYALNDSLLRQYARQEYYHPLVLFHLVQCLAVVSYFITSCKDPGYLSLKETDIESEHLIVKINDLSATDDDDRNSIAVVVPRQLSREMNGMNGYQPVNPHPSKRGCTRRSLKNRRAQKVGNRK